MDTMRLILLMAIGLVGMMLFQEWQQDYGTAPAETTVVEQVEDGSEQEIPDLSLVPEPDAEISEQMSPSQPADVVFNSLVSVITDVYEIDISLQGANIQRAALRKYPLTLDQPDQALALFDNTDKRYFIYQGGIRSSRDLPTHKSTFSTEQIQYEMEKGSDELKVSFYWEQDDVRVTKTYTFTRGSYVIDVDYQIDNNSADDIRLAAYNQLQRNDPGREGRRLLYTYTGAVISTPEKRYEKLSFDDLEKKDLKQNVTDGWVGMIEHYFVSALIPTDKNKPYQYYSISIPERNRYFIGAMTPAIDVAAGDQGILTHRVYVGPKIQDRLEELAPSLDLVVDYGILWFLAKPLFIGLKYLHSLTGNWGWAIILLTILIKLLFYPLSAAGYRSMANMRRVQPRLLSIRERYQNDKARLNQAMMDLYKEEKINPLGGCFPVLIQIPVFIALYWVLLESVEMRQSPFMFWLQDLSTPDPFFVLPLIMGVTMFLQQKLNPAPVDPVQQKVMSILPIVFTVFFAFFPSGLVLYWVSNNILSIAQQARINHTLEKAGLK